VAFYPPLLANSPDVGALLERLRRLHPLFGADRIMLATERDSTSLWLETTDARPAHPDSVDACFAMLCRLTRQLTTDAVTATRVTLRRTTPPDPAPYRVLLGDVRFAASRNLCTFDAHALRALVVGADPVVLSILEPYAERRIAERNTCGDFVATFVVAELRELPPLAAVARALALSPRSLQLQLAAEGTTFSAIVDRVQRERALALLSTSDLSITKISTLVGYSTPAAFTRAVHRWTGASPRLFRKHST
jgi:AraC-like DNA-binding protein